MTAAMALGRDRKSSVLTPVIRAAAGVFGVAVFAAGVAAVFVTENGTGAAALLAIGAAFMVVAVLGDRVQSVELGGVNLTIRDLARQTYALAREAEHRGDDESAARLRTVASELEVWLAATVACAGPCGQDMNARARSST